MTKTCEPGEGASVFLAPLERLAVGFRVGVALQQTTPMAPYVSGARVFSRGEHRMMVPWLEKKVEVKY